jgi:diguanylate cyclase (GGDEF)-like protein
VLLAIWLGSLLQLRMLIGLVLNVLAASAFVTVMYITDRTEFWMTVAVIQLVSAVLLGAYLGYCAERAQRLLFLQREVNISLQNRQEMWAFTLIDLDFALSGVVDFKELIELLKKHLEPVIEFDSYVLTSLEGQGPKPMPDKVEGALFESDDRTLWSEELLGKLTQTRQATVSAENETVAGFLGAKKQRFISYRLDIPIFNDSNMLGIISLRRESAPFDSLDMIASVSIAGQAMLIFKRSARPVSVTPPPPAVPDPIIRPKKLKDSTQTSTTLIPTSENRDMEMTDHSFSSSDQTLAPRDVITQFKIEEASAKKTITLMSRENADKIAVDQYRMAAIDGVPLSVLIIEVDGLSKLREQDGDEVAYKVFAAIVKYIFSKVDKEKDILGRYGQNGLSVLMPKVDMNAAERFAEMIRQFVATATYRTAYGEKSATLSIGVAAITDDTGNYGSMVKRADMALFVAKKNGRNCVKVRL